MRSEYHSDLPSSLSAINIINKANEINVNKALCITVITKF